MGVQLLAVPLTDYVKLSKFLGLSRPHSFQKYLLSTSTTPGIGKRRAGKDKVLVLRELTF